MHHLTARGALRALSLVALGLALSEVTATAGAQVPTAALEPPHARLAHVRAYHHCHNHPRRIYCHKRQRLPVNWPPNSDSGSKGHEAG
jgi:hypothetical protein